MVASTDTTFDLDRTGILRNAYQKLGVVPAGEDPSSAYLSMGSDALNVCLKSWENKGVFLSKVERTTTTLTSGTAQYTTDADTLDILVRTPYVSDGLGTDTKVEIITMGRYMEITDKDTQGWPTLMMVEKTDRVRFTLYPVPDSTVASITYPRTKLLTDMDSADNTTGLPSKYLRSLILQTALELSTHFTSAMMIEKRRELKDDLAEAITEATRDDTERGNLRLSPYYGLGWWRS